MSPMSQAEIDPQGKDQDCPAQEGNACPLEITERREGVQAHPSS